MKTTLLIALLQLLIYFSTSAQDTTVDSLVNINNIKLSNTYDFVGGTKYIFTKDKYIFTVKLFKKLIDIYRFDTETNEMINTGLDSVLYSKQIKVLTINKFDSSCIVLYVKKNNHEDSERQFNSLHYRRIDLEMGEIGQEVKLHEMKHGSTDEYQYCFSKDRAFLMVYFYVEEDNEPFNSRMVRGVIYQDSFKVFAQGVTTMAYDKETESIQSVFITNNATPHVIVKNDKTGFYKFHKLNLNNKHEKELVPQNQTKWGPAFSHFISDNRVDLVGTYDRGKQIFIQNLRNEEDVTIIDIPANVYQSIASYNYFRELILYGVRPCEDGGMLIILQENHKKIVREPVYENAIGNTYERVIEYHEDRLLVRLDKDKKIKWVAANIPQKRRDHNTVFQYYLIDNQHYFFTIEHQVDNGSLSIPPGDDLTKEELENYTKNKGAKVEVVKLCIVDDVSGQYRLFDLFNGGYQQGKELSRLELENIIVTNNVISIELYQSGSKNVMLNLPLKK